MERIVTVKIPVKQDKEIDLRRIASGFDKRMQVLRVKVVDRREEGEAAGPQPMSLSASSSPPEEYGILIVPTGPDLDA